MMLSFMFALMISPAWGMHGILNASLYGDDTDYGDEKEQEETSSVSLVEGAMDTDPEITEEQYKKFAKFCRCCFNKGGKQVCTGILRCFALCTCGPCSVQLTKSADELMLQRLDTEDEAELAEGVQTCCEYFKCCWAATKECFTSGCCSGETKDYERLEGENNKLMQQLKKKRKQLQKISARANTAENKLKETEANINKAVERATTAEARANEVEDQLKETKANINNLKEQITMSYSHDKRAWLEEQEQVQETRAQEQRVQDQHIQDENDEEFMDLDDLAEGL